MRWVQWHNLFMNGIKQRISEWQPRKLLCFSAAFSFIAVLVTLSVSYQVEDWSILLAGFVTAAVLLLLLIFGEKLVPVAVGLLLGFVWCAGYVSACYEPACDLAGYGGELTMQVLEYPDQDRPETLTVRLLSVAGIDSRVKTRLYLEDGIAELEPGDLLRCSGIVGEGDVHLSRNRLQKGIYLTVEPLEDSEIVIEKDGALDLVCRAERISKAIQLRIQRLIPGESGNLLAAMISGDSGVCGNSLQKALVNTGLAHIAAVSGLHISVLAGFFVTIFGKRKGYLISLPLILGYALIAGASPSALRAVIMQVIVMISVFFYREYDSMSALFTALLVLVMQNPFAALSTSLLLSFAATFGILLMNGPVMEAVLRYKPKHSVLNRLYFWATSSCSVSLSAMIFTMPITLLIFGRASMLSLVSNLLTVWLVSISMIGGMLLLAVSCISMPVAVLLAKIVRLPLMYLVWIIGKLGGFTELVGQGGSMILEIGAFASLLCFILVRFSKNSRMMGILVSCLILVGSFLISSLEPILYTEIQIYGNYGAPVIMVRDGSQTILIGNGKDSARSLSQIEETLSGWSRSQLSAVVCLSDRVKSTGGLKDVMYTFSPETVFLPENCDLSGMDTEAIRLFSQEGALSISDATGKMELIPVTEEIWALRWLCKDLSIVVLFDGQPMELAAGLELYTGDISADIWLTDAVILNSAYAAAYICGRISPAVILAADSSFTNIPKDILGVPVESLYQNGAITITTKR